jgi:hypothetical protein
MNADYAASGIIGIVPTPRLCRMPSNGIRLRAVQREVSRVVDRLKSA